MDLKQWSIIYMELHVSINLLFSKWRTKGENSYSLHHRAQLDPGVIACLFIFNWEEKAGEDLGIQSGSCKEGSYKSACDLLSHVTDFPVLNQWCIIFLSDTHPV